VKYLIPVAAILVLGFLGATHRAVEVPKPDRTIAGGNPEHGDLRGAPESVRGSRSPFPEPAAGTTGKPVATVPDTSVAADDVPASGIQEMLDLLRAKLVLGVEQEPRVKDALKQRVRDLAACQQAYRKNGVFVPAEYGKQLVRLKESWFRSIDGVLDSEQHLLFVQLVHDGFFRPGTEFTVDLGSMTVLR
jgi:hypothetical protein